MVPLAQTRLSLLSTPPRAVIGVSLSLSARFTAVFPAIGRCPFRWLDARGTDPSTFTLLDLIPQFCRRNGYKLFFPSLRPASLKIVDTLYSPTEILTYFYLEAGWREINFEFIACDNRYSSSSEKKRTANLSKAYGSRSRYLRGSITPPDIGYSAQTRPPPPPPPCLSLSRRCSTKVIRSDVVHASRSRTANCHVYVFLGPETGTILSLPT